MTKTEWKYFKRLTKNVNKRWHRCVKNAEIVANALKIVIIKLYIVIFRALLPSSTEEDGQKRTSNISGADQNNSDFVSDYGDQNDSDLGHTEVVQQGGPMLYSYSSRRSGAELISVSFDFFEISRENRLPWYLDFLD